VVQGDADLIETLARFKRAFETRAADPDWHPSEEGVREDLAVALRSALGQPTDSIHYEHPFGASRIDLWVAPSRQAIEVKFHRPIRSGHSRPLTQQYGALLADCQKLASADAADRLVVLVTDRAGATHLANKGQLPSSTGGEPCLVGTMEVEKLPTTAVGFLSYSGPWIPISVELIWRASGGPWMFFAWRIGVQHPATGMRAV
jgi:hypothetical protein